MESTDVPHNGALSPHGTAHAHGMASVHDVHFPTMFSVLVVEDNVAVRAAIARALDRRGCSVTTATNGLEGVEAVRARGFDVVITDLNMPERGGLWLWEQALRLRPLLRGRFVLISSDNRPGGQGMGLFLESEHFFVKPFSLDGLLDQVETIARRTGHNVGRDDSGGPDAADRDGMLPQVPDEV